VGVTSTGGATTVAIFAEGDLTQVIKDLRVAETVNQLPQYLCKLCKSACRVPILPGKTNGILTLKCQPVWLGTFSTCSSTTRLSYDSDVALMFNKFAHQNRAKAGSASFGLCEAFAYLDGSMLVDDEVFLEAAAQGQTFLASTGR